MIFIGALSNQSIIKVSSIDEMVTKQNEILKAKEIPVLIFHNNIDQNVIKHFSPQTNFITCNSFNIKPDAYLTSTNFLDMKSITKSITKSYTNKTLQGFYSDFTLNYYAQMKFKNQQNTLIYIGGGAFVGGGVFTIVYYNSK
ncbi:MAG: hypothetical protein IPF72_19855 [Chitinophagaceae bacterium]|nr:hypothetical protein [Chitinophagaceae bacterium]